ncbi:MAG: hypothetical protein ACJ79R_03090, partial [Anaeromyxobacteraceae bacterium]
DFLRVGTPVTLVLLAILTVLVPRVWPFESKRTAGRLVSVPGRSLDLTSVRGGGSTAPAPSVVALHPWPVHER